MTKTPEQKLEAAREREAVASSNLQAAAEMFVGLADKAEALDELHAAAKTYTNAMHQRSRCEKHVREASS